MKHRLIKHMLIGIAMFLAAVAFHAVMKGMQ